MNSVLFKNVKEKKSALLKFWFLHLGLVLCESGEDMTTLEVKTFYKGYGEVECPRVE